MMELSGLKNFTLATILIWFTSLSAFALDPVAGKEYNLLIERQPTENPAKIEVMYFFSYGSSESFSLLPALQRWSKSLPSDVVIRKVPLGFTPSMIEYQKLYYALVRLGREDELNAKIFAEVHTNKHALDRLQSMSDFLIGFGINKSQFTDIYNSFLVASQTRRAAQLTMAYKVDSTSVFAVDGRYFTNLSYVNQSQNNIFDIITFLINKRRTEKK